MSKTTKTNWELMKLLLAHSRTILFYGPPSVGKSYLALHTPHVEKDGVVNITITPETPAAELRGHYVPVGGEFVWKDGPAVLAWRKGWRLILNELDHASGDTFSFLLALLDTPASATITLPTGETIRPHKNFQCVATMNGNPEDLPEALRSRFPVSIEVADPNPAAIQSLPADLQEAARGSCINPDPNLRISLRSWFEYAHLRTLIDPQHAAEAVFGKRSKDVLAGLTIAKS